MRLQDNFFMQNTTLNCVFPFHQISRHKKGKLRIYETKGKMRQCKNQERRNRNTGQSSYENKPEWEADSSDDEGNESDDNAGSNKDNEDKQDFLRTGTTQDYQTLQSSRSVPL